MLVRKHFLQEQIRFQAQPFPLAVWTGPVLPRDPAQLAPQKVQKLALRLLRVPPLLPAQESKSWWLQSPPPIRLQRLFAELQWRLVRALRSPRKDFPDHDIHNTVDCLEHVRILKNRGIGIFFEEQNIDTLSIDSELYLVIYAGFAQSESESMSKNITWAYRKRFEDGKVMMQYKTTLGYKKRRRWRAGDRSRRSRDCKADL